MEKNELQLRKLQIFISVNIDIKFQIIMMLKELNVS